MPTLDWIGKRAVVNHHREVPYRRLEAQPAWSVGDPGAGNLVVQGDNLLALKALLPHYAGQVKLIYIDPPYNTGNESWVYNDNVNAPEIRDWLGQVVGPEAQDLSRHDKWLCMMYPRLCLLREFLSADGAIFVSIDDNEVAPLRLIMDEVFGGGNFVANVAWQKRVSPANDAKHFSSDHDYIAVFARSKNTWRPRRLPRTAAQLRNYRNPDDDPRGPWNPATYTCNKSAEERPNLYYGIVHPSTGEIIWPRRTAVWKYDEATHLRHVAENRLWWGVDGRARMPRIKAYLADMGDVVPRSVWMYGDAGHTQQARGELLELLPNNAFITPKPVRLLRRILDIASDPDSLILDAFAGSGTTGQAVLEANRADGGSRRFVLVEMDESICSDVTAPRLERVIAQGSEQGGLPGVGGGEGFRYVTLGEPLFDARGRVAADVTFAALAAHVWFTETGSPLPAGPGDSPLLGVHGGKAVYLLFNGVLRDRRPQGGNVLTSALLAGLPPHAGPRVVYGESCRLGAARLAREGVVFRQVPYGVRTE